MAPRDGLRGTVESPRAKKASSLFREEGRRRTRPFTADNEHSICDAPRCPHDRGHPPMPRRYTLRRRDRAIETRESLDGQAHRGLTATDVKAVRDGFRAQPWSPARSQPPGSGRGRARQRDRNLRDADRMFARHKGEAARRRQSAPKYRCSTTEAGGIGGVFCDHRPAIIADGQARSTTPTLAAANAIPAMVDHLTLERGFGAEQACRLFSVAGDLRISSTVDTLPGLVWAILRRASSLESNDNVGQAAAQRVVRPRLRRPSAGYVG